MKIILTISVILFLFGCHNSDSKEIKTIEDDLNYTSDTSYFEQSYYFKNKLILEDKLSITKIRYPKSDSTLRVWIREGNTNGGHVIILEKSKNNWESSAYFYIESFPQLPNPATQADYLKHIKIDSSFKKTNNETYLIPELFTSLNNQGILNLINQDQEENWFPTVNDGITYSIEIQMGDKYNFVTYNCPDVYAKKYESSRIAFDIIETLDSAIGLEMWHSIRCLSK